MTALLFARPRGGRVELSQRAIAEMGMWIQDDGSKHEAGGVLLGRLIVDCDDVVVDLASAPSNGDKRTRFSFFRARRPAQRLVDQKWSESSGTCVYLGEWHTHPQDDPQPSGQDLRNWSEILRQARYEGASLFFVIVGISTTNIWEGAKATGEVTPLPPAARRS